MLALAVMLSLLPGNVAFAADIFDGGDGKSEATAYEIRTLDQLKAFRDDVNGGNGYRNEYIKLVSNIDLQGSKTNQWTPIGNATNKFKGTFDACGYKITGMYIDNSNDYQGFFGYTESGTYNGGSSKYTAVIKNLGVSGTVKGNGYVGSIIARNLGKVINCYSTCTVSGVNDIGGIAGYNADTVEDCYNTGAVSGNEYVGGVAGSNYGSLNRCYNIGKVSGAYSYYTGGVTGVVLDKKYPKNCYYLQGTATGGIEGSDAYGRAEVRSKEQLKEQSKFSGWNFSNTWVMDDERPLLRTNLEATGSDVSPYIISNLAELKTFRDAVNNGNDYAGKAFKLTADIDLNGSETDKWTPIGNAEKNFKGTFDGGGKKIQNLYIDSTEQYQGLFGYVNLGCVKNLSVLGSVKSTAGYAGGIVGYLNNGTVENCTSECTVTGRASVGGIVGIALNTSEIKLCQNKGNVTATDASAGGVVGYASSKTQIINCSNIGNISAVNQKAGGIVGFPFSQDENSAKVEYCYSAGTISAPSDAGGIIGADMIEPNNCYYLGNCAAEGTVLSNTRGTAKPAADFANGAVAYLLQGTQDKLIWGQGVNNDDYPVVTNDESKRMYKVKFMVADGEDSYTEFAAAYTNKGKTVTLPSPQPGDMYNYKWMQTKEADGEIFDATTSVYSDMEVYALTKIEITVEDTNAPSDTLVLHKNKETDIDLNDYVANKSGAEKNFTFSLLSEQKLPDGLELANGKITGIPEKVGIYTVKFNVSNNSEIAMMSLNQNGDELTLTFDVNLEGSGTKDSPYLINDVSEITYFRDKVNSSASYRSSCARLEKDIDMSSASANDVWTPIGREGKAYTGTFDGNGKKISSLGFNATENDMGLFGVISGGTVKNFTVYGAIGITANAGRIGGAVGYAKDGATIDGVSSYIEIDDERTGITDVEKIENRVSHIGGIVGNIEKSIVKNCKYYDNVTIQVGGSVGGIVGIATGGFNNGGSGTGGSTISGCENHGNVTSNGNSAHVGGIAGEADIGTDVKYCINYGKVISGGSDCIGGVVAYSNQNSRIEYCANIGEVTCTSENGGYIGGILGYINNKSFKSLANCYNYGKIVSNTGTENHPGAVVGWSRDITVSVFKNNYWLKDSSSAAYGGNAISDVYVIEDSVFKSGEAAYCLNGKVSNGVWKQNLDTDGEKDELPNFTGASVNYGYINCFSESKTYTNKQVSDTPIEHNYVNGFCTSSGEYQAASYNSTTGYYEISNAGQLYWFAALVNGTLTDIEQNASAKGILKDNIKVNPGTFASDGKYTPEKDENVRTWTPIGTKIYNKYVGTFDGNGKTVSGLYFNDEAGDHIGLFGIIGDGAAVQNVGVINSYFYGKEYVGGVTGKISESGTLTNCYNDSKVGGKDHSIAGVCGEVTTSKGTVKITGCYNGKNGTIQCGGNTSGGVVGNAENTYGTIEISNCCNEAEINGKTWFGGIVGYLRYGSVKNCYNTGNMSGYYSAGGVVGIARDENTIENCYNTGEIKGNRGTGGVIGFIDSFSVKTVSIKNCYNTGNVTWIENDYDFHGLGGIVGSVDFEYGLNITMSNCYNAGAVYDKKYAGAIIGEYYNTDNGTSNLSDCYYLEGSAKDGSNKVQNGIGCATEGSCTEDEQGKTIVKNADAFESGEVAYLLNGTQTEKIWGQKIGTDKYPLLNGEKVEADEYKGENVYRNKIDGFKILMYGACEKNANVVLGSGGTYTVVFADYEDGKLVNAEAVKVTAENAQAVRAAITKNFELGKDDKVMLWKDVSGITPMCETYVVK